MVASMFSVPIRNQGYRVFLIASTVLKSVSSALRSLSARPPFDPWKGSPDQGRSFEIL